MKINYRIFNKSITMNAEYKNEASKDFEFKKLQITQYLSL